MVFDPNAFIQDLLAKKQSASPLGQRAPSIKDKMSLDPIDRTQDRQRNLLSKQDIISGYSPTLEPEDKYLDMADELMFRANQIAQQAAITRVSRPVNFTGGPGPVGPRAAVQQIRGKKQKGAPVAKGDFGAFVNAIAGKESGGSYTARNPHSGAMGKYQIMPSNIAGPGGWDMEILGRNITTQQFMNNPALQDKIALGKLRQYYNKYGVRGAASAWYSGDPNKWQNTSPQGGYPSIAAYVADIVRRMGQR